MSIFYYGNKDAKGKHIMTQLQYECPLCKEKVANPSELREHRLREHRDIFSEMQTVVYTNSCLDNAG
jgi:hypothetical protein